MSYQELDPALDPALDQVSRRSFVEKMSVSTLAAAFLGQAALAQEGKPSALKDANLVHEDVWIESGGQRIEAFLCRPKEEGRRGSVIVIQEIFGLNDHIKDIACRCAKAGYNGLAINFFTREGKPPSVEEGFPKLFEFVSKIPDAQVLGDIQAGAGFLRGRSDSNGKVGVAGFCWGGRFSMLAAAGVPDLNAAVAYYGRIRLAPNADRAKQPHGPIDLVDKMNAPLLGHFGAQDRGIPVADVEALRDELKKHGKTAELHIYEGANHAFNNDTRESYNADAARLAWKRTLEWYDKYLRG
jgi:carboxymethylenebutenolidase